MPLKCPSCGFTDEGKFCKHCGAPLVSEATAAHVGAPAFTGVHIPPPTATEGFKAERDLEVVGLEGDEEGSEESWNGSFGVILIVMIVGALLVFGLKMLGGGFH